MKHSVKVLSTVDIESKDLPSAVEIVSKELEKFRGVEPNGIGAEILIRADVSHYALSKRVESWLRDLKVLDKKREREQYTELEEVDAFLCDAETLLNEVLKNIK